MIDRRKDFEWSLECWENELLEATDDYDDAVRNLARCQHGVKAARDALDSL